MFAEIELDQSHVMLCGAPERTQRVALKYGAAAQLSRCAKVSSLAVADPFALAVICCSDEQEQVQWRQALQPHGAAIIIDPEPEPSQPGKVYLVGAGPGASDLVTRGALKALAQADLVLLDHLAPQQQVQQWAPHAQLIDVGKIPGKHRVPQEEIDRLMVEHALAGEVVVRFKGGDPYVFGRGAEEEYVCQQAGVPVEVIPGVSAAIAVPAAAGVPLSLRGLSRVFAVASGHQPLSASQLDYLAALLADGGTLSLLMGVKTLAQTATGLAQRQVDPDLPVLAIENGYRPHQSITFSTLAQMIHDFQSVKPPAVLVLGQVVGSAGPDRDAVMAAAFETHNNQP